MEPHKICMRREREVGGGGVLRPMSLFGKNIHRNGVGGWGGRKNFLEICDLSPAARSKKLFSLAFLVGV